MVSIVVSEDCGNTLPQYSKHVCHNISFQNIVLWTWVSRLAFLVMLMTLWPWLCTVHCFSADLDSGVIRYVLLSPESDVTQDSFMFDILDSKPHRVHDNIFHIIWSVISFGVPLLNITETAGVIQIPVIRKGNLKQVKLTHISCHLSTSQRQIIYIYTHQLYKRLLW